MSKSKTFLVVLLTIALGFGATYGLLVFLGGTGALNDWIIKDKSIPLRDVLIGRTLMAWMLSIPLALVSVMMTSGRLKFVCQWAPIYAPLAVMAGLILAGA